MTSLAAPIKVMLVEDHSLVSQGIATLLNRIKGLDVVAIVSSGEEALERINRQPPDVVLMDISMGGMNGLEATAEIGRRVPTVRVLMLSMHNNELYVRKALQSGARGYLLKDAEVTELEFAIRAVARGDMYLTPGVAKHMLSGNRIPPDATTNAIPHPATNVAPHSLSHTPPAPPLSHHHEAAPELTSRQREVLSLIAQGLTTQEIARRLYVSAKTVEAHRAQLMQRLKIRDIPGLVRYAIRQGLITSDD